ncbi:TlpA family protein disulfide reductase [Chitinophaga rhizophila]|uniref:TlpA family protein disulfide reductase n=1 Tax=Chitinophaga rhizophila TaxID=2866212 RepID=A0ABS7G5Q4_9BACT|nr:TlpA disulfide reductase family protein [Chitinophaga rhizophila]MBW8682973.1 TlpA family protein disulfide reductase [Chitinophaga rhizophila]
MKKWMSVLTLSLGIVYQAFSQTDSSRLTGLGTPVAGDTIRLTYDPKGGPLQGKDNIRAIIYMFNDYRWELDDIELRDSKGKLEGKYGLPANCAFVAIKFITEENGYAVAGDNNNDLGFVATTVDKNGSKLPGSVLAWGTFRKPSINKAPQGYFDQKNISDEALEMWVRKEMKDFPQNMPKYFDTYITMLKISKGDEFAEVAPRNLDRFISLPGVNEAGYITVWDTYRFQLKNEKKADSIRNVIIQKFPKGRTMRMAKYQASFAKDAETPAQIAALEKFLQEFPVAAYRQDSTATQGFIYHNTYRTLETLYFDQGMYDKALALVPEMTFATLNDVYHANIHKAFSLKQMPPEQLYPISKAFIDAMIQRRNDLSYREGMQYTPRQANENAVKQLDTKLAVHIRLLNKIGKYDEALQYLVKLSDAFKYSNANLNEARISILENTGNKQLVLPMLELAIKLNTATPAMIEQLKKQYVLINGKEDGFEQYMESLKSAEDVARTKEEIRSNLINGIFPTFKLKDINGKTVDAAAWKDKIVVLDFWATWCGPCKMAFPGMQMAVDKYANDPGVAFYFISTMENNQHYKQEVKDYMKSSGFRFNVLFDEVAGKNGTNNKVFRSMLPVFHSSAIPRKAVIKNGVIRYTAEGYQGSPSKLADELTYVIDILKAEN